jgi:hypothetical protein
MKRARPHDLALVVHISVLAPDASSIFPRLSLVLGQIFLLRFLMYFDGTVAQSKTIACDIHFQGMHGYWACEAESVQTERQNGSTKLKIEQEGGTWTLAPVKELPSPGVESWQTPSPCLPPFSKSIDVSACQSASSLPASC